MKTVVSEKGQITIPKKLRDRLGLSAGVVIEFDSVDGKLVGRKRIETEALLRWVGKGVDPRVKTKRPTSDAYLKSIRDR